MKGYASIEALAQALFQAEPASPVREIRVRLGGSMSEASAREAFGHCVRGTALEKAELTLEPSWVPAQCGCGHRATINVTEQDGYPYVCPECGDLVEVSPGPALELVEIIYERPEGPGWAGANAARREGGELD